MEKSKRMASRSENQSDIQNISTNQANLENNFYKGKISLNIPMYTIAFASFVYPPLVGVFCLIVYILEGRIAGYLPTISETGTDHPNTNYFAIFMSTGAISTIVTLFFYFNSFVLARRLQKKEKIEKKSLFDKNFTFLEKVLIILIFTSTYGIVALGFSPINEAHSRHLLSAVIGFLSILIFELITFLNDPNKTGTLIKIIRWTSWTIAILSFILFAAAKWVFSHRIDVTISTFAEWFLLVFMLFVYSTWKKELNSYELSLVIL